MYVFLFNLRRHLYSFLWYLRSTVGQTRLSSIAIIYIERCYVDRTLQLLMDRIFDIFGERMRSAHVLIVLLCIGLRRLVQLP